MSSEEASMKITLNKNEEEEKKGYLPLPNFEDLTMEQWNAVRHALALSLTDINHKLTGEIPDESGSSSSPSIDHFEDDEEMPAEERLDRSTRNGRPEETSEADKLQTVDLVDCPDDHGRPSERQKDGPLGVQPTVDVVDRSIDHGRPSEGQKDELQRDDETVDREEENGRPSPRQNVRDPEQLQTVDPMDRSTDGGRPSSSEQAMENLGRGQREKRPNVRLADYVTHVAGSHVGEKCKYPLASYVTHEKFSDRHKCFLSALDAGVEPTSFKKAF
ncbi:unnamed protein product [Cuscuta campestris]|uniref:Uncharacterized protein n=1 Tax=Cuscuta campestris TaxID=132261 RepID=A0A484NQH4_9ASTE|nr:unnamed protein product [Cuscuta campestris]